MTQISLAHIVRHPIKSVGYQDIERAALEKGRPLPFDRAWAVATVAAGTQDTAIEWMPKMRFLRGAAEGALQAVQADFDEVSGTISLMHPDRPTFTGRIPDDGEALIDWLRPLWPPTRPSLSHLVHRADGGAMGDWADPFIALHGLSSLKALSQHAGVPLSRHRWRGNLWLDGLAPWEEFDLVGREIAIGEAKLTVEQPITRCVATTFDPETGRQNIDTLAVLERTLGHTDFGVYARVTQPGLIACGDTVRIL